MPSPRPGAKKHRTPGRLGRRGAVSRSTDDRTPCLVPVLGLRRSVAVAGTRHGRIAAVAARQRGRVSRAQLLRIEIPDRAIYRLVASGHLIRVHRGVYAVGHTAPAPLADETAALLACGSDAVLSHQTSAHIHGIRRSEDTSIRITVPRDHRLRLPGVHVHRTSSLPPADLQIREGLPVTSATRTLLDLAAVLEQRDLEWAIDEAIQQRLVSLRNLRRAVDGWHGRGMSALRRAADRHRPSGVTKSVAEKRFLALIRAAGLPEPRTNVKLHGFEVDCYWPDSQLVVEVDSFRWHSTRPKFEHDSRKGATLIAHGLSVMRVTWHQMEDESYAVVARTAQALTRAA